jgi:hypothetical protein
MEKSEVLQGIVREYMIAHEGFMFDGQIVEYDVISKDIPVKAPKWFIAYNRGHPFISDEVEKSDVRNYRKPMVLHEVMEFGRFQGRKRSCVKALKQELKVVDSREMRKYVGFRIGVFEELLKFLAEEDGDRSRALVPEVGRSLRYLRGL